MARFEWDLQQIFTSNEAFYKEIENGFNVVIKDINELKSLAR